MSRTAYIIINWIAVIVVITVNALANILPINGMNTGEVSALYPNHFVPAAYTFNIWIFIYLLLILHASYSTYILMHLKRSGNAIGMLVYKLNPLFWLTCLLNISWILAWHYLQVGLSVIIMILLFCTLLRIFQLISIAEKEIALGYMEHISLETPFIIYFSWIAVALIANITAFLVSIGWHPQNEIMWTCIMILVAAVIGGALSVFWHRPAYTAVILWALIGIYVKQAPESDAVGYATIAACLICVVSALYGFWHKRKLLFRPSVQID